MEVDTAVAAHCSAQATESTVHRLSPQNAREICERGCCNAPISGRLDR